MILTLNSLTKSFAGRAVTKDVTLGLAVGKVQALIGPNGAGKSTLIALMSGQLRPDAGQIRLDGILLNRVQPYERVRKGLVRSFQISSVFLPLTVRENIVLALLSREAPHFRFFRATMRKSHLVEQAEDVAVQLGLADELGTPAADLSHGGRRLLELAMTLALTPRVLLLDEPMAGLSEEEAERVAGIIEATKVNRAVLLVEHDLDMVFRLSDTIAVLVEGQVIANDTPEAIRQNTAVQQAYLLDSDLVL